MTRHEGFTRIAASAGKRRAIAAVLCISMVAAVGGVLATAQAGTPTQTIFGSVVPKTQWDPDAQAVEVGVKFKVLTAGTISGVRYFKGIKNGGTHVGTLWTASGSRLARVVFRHESRKGWQSASFATPVAVSPGQTYVVSYHTNVGHYSADDYAFAGKGAGTQQVQALADGIQGGNGLYKYSAAAGTFPTSSWKQTNYYVDVTFQPSPTATVTSTTLAPTTTRAPATTTSTTRPPPPPPRRPPRPRRPPSPRPRNRRPRRTDSACHAPLPPPPAAAGPPTPV